MERQNYLSAPLSVDGKKNDSLKSLFTIFQSIDPNATKGTLSKLVKNIRDLLALSEIEENKQVNEVTRIERKKIVKLLKEFELNFKELVGFEKAIVTSGGVDLKEIDSKTMKSKIIDNLYFAGEILDINGPTGGYNLQVAWSTGYLAGENSLLSKTL